MTYKHDIFISYMHDEQMEDWVHLHLVPFLRSFVGNALNRPIDIFVDRNGILSGDSWPLRLQSALARSRCLIPIWYPLYFHSEWCRRECVSMLHREKQLGYRTIKNPSGLVIPINVFDGDFFPDLARGINWLDCKEFWIVGDGFKKTEKYVSFQDSLKRWACQPAKAIAGSPSWEARFEDATWFDVPDLELMPKPIDNYEFTGLDA